MARVTGAAWELYTAHLEAQRQAAFDSAFKWAMNHRTTWARSSSRASAAA